MVSKNASKTAWCFCRAWKAACWMKQRTRETAWLGLKTFFIHGLFLLRHVPTHVAEDTLWLSPDAARPPMLRAGRFKSLLILARLQPGFQTHLVPPRADAQKNKTLHNKIPPAFLGKFTHRAPSGVHPVFLAQDFLYLVNAQDSWPESQENHLAVLHRNRTLL